MREFQSAPPQTRGRKQNLRKRFHCENRFQSAPPQTRGRKDATRGFAPRGRLPGFNPLPRKRKEKVSEDCAVREIPARFNPLPRKREGESPAPHRRPSSAPLFQSAPPQTRGRKWPWRVPVDRQLNRVSIRSSANAREKAVFTNSVRVVSLRFNPLPRKREGESRSVAQ